MKSNLAIIPYGANDPELMTLKGVKALKQAQVVIYHHELNRSLLDYCSESALKLKLDNCDDPNLVIFLLKYYSSAFSELVWLSPEANQFNGLVSWVRTALSSADFNIAFIPGVLGVVSLNCQYTVPLTIRGLNEGYIYLSDYIDSPVNAKSLATMVQSEATVAGKLSGSTLRKVVDIIREVRGEEECLVLYDFNTFDICFYGLLNEYQSRDILLDDSVDYYFIFGEVIRHSEIFKERHAQVSRY